MKKKFFSGDSIKQAVLQAARHFQLDPEEIAYSEVERRHGFLKSRKRAVIAVDTENPRREGSTAEASEPAAPEPEAPRRDEPAEVAAPTAPTAPTEHSRESVGDSFMAEAEEVWARSGSTTFEEDAEAEEDGDHAAGDEVREVSSSDYEPQEQIEDPVEAAGVAMDRLLDLGGLKLDAEISQGDERLDVELRGTDEDILLEDRGRLLLAIQHLLPRMLRGLTGSSTPCWVDCDNFHEIRAEQLRDMAQRVASEVRRSRSSSTLEPMAPDERRIVHMTLADDPAVETESQGNGLFKRVQVRAVRRRPRGFDPYKR